mgnify:CR=1 FL=1
MKVGDLVKSEYRTLAGRGVVRHPSFNVRGRWLGVVHVMRVKRCARGHREVDVYWSDCIITTEIGTPTRLEIINETDFPCGALEVVNESR